MAPLHATVVFGDVIASRRTAREAAERLRRLCQELDRRYHGVRLARFEFTQGDEIQGLLAPEADPFEAASVAALLDGALPMRWVACYGQIDAGRGPATQRTGEAFVAARSAIARARARRDDLLASTGDPDADALLDRVAPALGSLLSGLTTRQRDVGRLVLLDGRSQAEAAEILGVTQPTVSVTVARGELRSIERLHEAATLIYRAGVDS